MTAKTDVIISILKHTSSGPAAKEVVARDVKVPVQITNNVLMGLREKGLIEYEKVQVANVSNGERLETYVITGEPGSGTICLNGAAARKGNKGDGIIIIAYALIHKEEAAEFKPKIVKVDGSNKAV